MADNEQSRYLQEFQKMLATDAEFAKFRRCRKCMDHVEHEHVKGEWRCKHCKTVWQR